MILCVCPNPAVDKFVYLDDLKAGKSNRINQELSYPGGKGIHVALGIKELGEEVSILAFWGGATGQWIRQECEARGITCYGPEVADLTRTCLTIKSNNEFNETELLGRGPQIGPLEYAAFLKDYKSLLKRSNIISMSGSWPQNSVGASYSPFIEMAAAVGIKSFIDCSGNLLKDALTKRPFAVHSNEHEVRELYGCADPIAMSLKLGGNCNLAAVTFGERGLYLYDGKKMVHALCEVENVISAVGSGDSLTAGLIVAHKKKYGLVETAKLAAAAGAANCIRTALGMFYKKDVEQLLQNCEINVQHLNEKP